MDNHSAVALPAIVEPSIFLSLLNHILYNFTIARFRKNPPRTIIAAPFALAAYEVDLRVSYWQQRQVLLPYIFRKFGGIRSTDAHTDRRM
jgi:hypothetical protein